MKKRRKIVGLIIGLAVAAGISGCAEKEDGVIWESSFSEAQKDALTPAGETDALEAPESETVREQIVVDICGAVAHPGVYELTAGARVCDAIELAGGLLENADLDSLNQAAFLHDADKVRVYSIGETAQGSGQQLPANGTVAPQKVNINQADSTQLCTLSGIGEARARDIIAYREANGSFQSIEDIMKVSGIKEATFNRIKDDITVW